jgi:hypothetical protein
MGDDPAGGSHWLMLDLRRHCIETALRSAYNRALAEVLRLRTPDPQTERRLSLLQAALEQLDFPALRSRFRELAGNCPAQVAIGEEAPGRIGVRIAGRAIAI